MKDRRWARVGLSAILAGCMCTLGCSSVPAQRTYTGPPATIAYITGNGGTNTWGIAEYSTVAAENGASLGTLTLSPPDLPQVFATDLAGQIYVAACSTADSSGKVVIYPANSVGASIPSRTIDIGVCSYGEDDIRELVVAPTGLLYVLSESYASTSQTVSVYSAESSGTAVPMRTLKPAEVVYDFAADADGSIFIATSSPAGNGVIDVYAATAAGSDAPIRTLTLGNYANVYGVAVDSTGSIFANVCPSECTGTDFVIDEFAPGANGAATPINTITILNVSVASLTRGLGGGPVRLDGVGNIFTSLRLISEPGANVTEAIYGFGPSATGNAPPTVQILVSDSDATGPGFAVN